MDGAFQILGSGHICSHIPLASRRATSITRPKDLWLPPPRSPCPARIRTCATLWTKRTWRTEVMASDSRLQDRYVRTQPASRLQLVVLVLLSLAASTFVQATQFASYSKLQIHPLHFIILLGSWAVTIESSWCPRITSTAAPLGARAPRCGHRTLRPSNTPPSACCPPLFTTCPAPLSSHISPSPPHNTGPPRPRSGPRAPLRPKSSSPSKLSDVN